VGIRQSWEVTIVSFGGKFFRPSERFVQSAKGAKYESQGQAPNNVRRVAPGYQRIWRWISETYFALSVLFQIIR